MGNIGSLSGVLEKKVETKLRNEGLMVVISK